MSSIIFGNIDRYVREKHTLQTMNKPSLYLLTFFLLTVASACEKNNQRDFPFVSFNEIIYLNNPSSIELQSPGGAAFNPGGYRGLIIFRRFANNEVGDFAAYDRACPEHYADDCSSLELSDDRVFAECVCHGEKYLLFDGSPGESATISMLEYRCTFDGTVIRASN
jgi:nitrite reductase/ring-hydroxylating ferredoxin subunit